MSDQRFEYMQKVTSNSDLRVLHKIIKDLNEFQYVPEVQDRGCMCIWTLGTNPAHKKKLLEFGVGEVILNALDNHQKNSGVLKVALAAIKNLEGNLYAFNEKGAGIKVLNTMKKFEHIPRIQEYGSSAIRTLATSRPNSLSLMKSGACDSLLVAIHKHKDKEKVVKAVCGAVFSLSLLEPNRKKIWESGLMHFVLKAMQDHSSAEKVQEYGSVRLEAGQKLYRALDRHPQNPRIAEYSSSAVSQMAQIKINADILMEQNIDRSLIRAVRVHIRNEDVVSFACHALWNLCIWEDHKPTLMNNGLGDLMVDVLNSPETIKNSEFSSAVGNVYGVLTNLSATKELGVELLKLKAISAIVSSVKYFSTESVQVKALCAIRNLGFWEDGRKIQNQSAIGTVQRAMQMYPKNETIIRKGQEFFDNMKKLGPPPPPGGMYM
eukprot:snap_masked-scaffold_21-processed-gene-1.22-mRNA-1 protein AED:1.00 eAED:1.00 QI:0/0/0/0/1/1/2/0/433